METSRWLAVLAVTGLCLMGNSVSAAQEMADVKKDKPGVTYHVSAGVGKDSNDGLSPRSAWQTIARVNSARLKP